MINKTLLQKRFNVAAVSYDQYANVQKKMAHSLLSTLDRRYSANSSIRILELGCGTGYVTEQLSNLFPKAHITAIDFAESMIAVAKTRQNVKNVMFYCEDIERLQLEETYDVIISNATFQWLNDLKQVIRNLFHHLSIDGILLFSTFGQETFQELHTSFQRAKEEKNIQNETSIGQRFYSKNQLRHICEVEQGMCMFLKHVT